ncbi:MAG: Lrp/AsnC family transcriptional regulator [Candidatus Hermodarchaeota archaeon]
MISDKIGIDDIDCKIIDLIQKEPNLTHTEIANYVNRSQPTVGMRIKKLENLGVLKYQAGINIRVADLCFARIELQTKNPKHVFDTVKKCPFMLTAFRLSGDTNVSILLAGLTLKELDQVVNNHFRGNPEVTKVHMDIIEDISSDFVLPIDLTLEFGEISFKGTCCEKCS